MYLTLFVDMARDVEARRGEVHRQQAEQIAPSASERPTLIVVRNHAPQYFVVIITIKNQVGNMYPVTAAMPGKLSKEAQSPRSDPDTPAQHHLQHDVLRPSSNLIYATKSGNAEL